MIMSDYIQKFWIIHNKIKALDEILWHWRSLLLNGFSPSDATWPESELPQECKKHIVDVMHEIIDEIEGL